MDEHPHPEPDRPAVDLDLDVDVVIIGGGAAGLSAALTLGRARRSVVVVDSGTPRNAPAHGVHAFLTRDGTPPAELSAIGRKEVEGYGVRIIDGAAVSASGDVDAGFVVELADGRALHARRLLVTTGLVDELPEIRGLRERWGHDVIHCPYCHGWEVRDQPLLVLNQGTHAAMKTELVRQWSFDVTLLAHTGQPLDDEQRDRLAARGVRIVEGEVVEVVIDDDDRMRGVRLADGLVVPGRALVISPRMVARSNVLAGLGLEPVEHPGGVGTHIPSEAMGQTSVPGVYVAGNVTDLMLQVLPSAAGGATAGAAINAELVLDDTNRVLARVRAAELPPPMDAAFWDDRYAAHEHVWSGNPNATLVAGAEGLTPGRALEVGAGEGADAVWLAEQGWQVTAVDVSSVAIEKARAHAAERLGDRAAAIDWQVRDATTWAPPVGTFDLVSAQFIHLVSGFDAFIERCATAVAPGGTLIVAGHHPSDIESRAPRPALPDLMFTAVDIVRLLGTGWTIVDADPRPRIAHDHDGPFTIHDTLLVARRDG